MRRLTTAALIGLVGCYTGFDGSPTGGDSPPGQDGGADGENDDGADDSGPDSGPDREPGAEGGPGVGTYRMMRLTRAEYDATVLDLLGIAPSETFPPDEKVGPFDANVIAPPSELILELYMNSAESLAAAAIEDLEGLTGCAPEAVGTAACADAFIDDFARRAYRRPLRDADVDALRSNYDVGAALSGFAHGIELVVRATLQSPHFLYRIEEGTPLPDVPTLAALDGYEVASRLSYFLWGTMPDDELFAAAGAGDLDDVQGVETQARRMLESTRAAPVVAKFHEQWMGLGATIQKDTTVFPEFDDALANSMRREVGLFAADVVLEGEGTLEALLTSPYTFVDADLAALYDIEFTGESPDAFVRVDLDPQERAGLLTQTGVLAATSKPTYTTPVLRGLFVRTNLLCTDLPPPPPDVNEFPIPDDTIPQREQLADHRENPGCAACHQLMDPIGYGLDHFDALGRYRTMQGQFEVDASAEMTATEDINGPFYGAIELADKLASSPQVSDCMARQWFRYALGRFEEDERDATTVTRLTQAARSGDIRELLVDLATSDGLRYRRIGEDDA